MANHNNLGSLGRRLRRIADIVEDNSTDVVRGTALVADQVVVQGTPVLSGRARSGWDVAIGIEPSSVPQSDPSSPEAGAAEALAKGRSVIERWKVGQPGIYISNGLPYIRRLEDGYSAQAPAGMVTDAAAAAREFANRQKLLKGVR
jgi:hypothetical protein